jgi:hypothetical protein
MPFCIVPGFPILFEFQEFPHFFLKPVQQHSVQLNLLLKTIGFVKTVVFKSSFHSPDGQNAQMICYKSFPHDPESSMPEVAGF